MKTPASAGAVGFIGRASDRVAAAAATPSRAAAVEGPFLFAPAMNRRTCRIPLAITLLSLLLFLAVVPFARMRLPHAWAIMPSYESALVVNVLITAILLFAQFAMLRSRALLALASGYLFVALMIIPHTLTFPGLLSPGGLLGAGPQSTVWLYLFWHAGLALAVIAYALLEHENRAKPLAQASVRPALVLGIAVAAAAAGALTLLATVGHASLPTLVRNNGYTPAIIAAGATVWMAGLAALMALWMRRPRSMLDLWLMAVMCAWLLDVALSTLLNGAPFDLGFYAGRIYALVAACILLPVLLLEAGAIYAQPDRPPEADLREAEGQPGEVAADAIGRSRADEPSSGECPARAFMELPRWPLASLASAARLDGLGHARAEEIFRLAVDACPGGIVMIDSGGKIVVVNTEAEQMFGYRSNELIGRSVDMLVPERLRPQYVRLLQQLEIRLDSRRIGLRRDLFGLRKDGSEFPAELGLNPLRTREGPMVLGVIVDISERRQMERLKDEFVSTVSHELRTPLTSIAASLGLLRGAAHIDLPATAKRLITIAHSNSERLVRLINDILDIEKIESGNVSFDLERVEVAALVAQTIEANRALADSCGVQLRLEDSGIHEVRADPDRLMQVVTNLLSNAIKFSPRAAPASEASGRRGNSMDARAGHSPEAGSSARAAEVTVSVAARNGKVRISVRDQGQGIPESFRPHVFEKFAQADETAGRPKSGSGLGLSIVKQIVLRHGGEVGFLDAPGGGTIFYAELPDLDSADHRDAEHRNGVNGAHAAHGDDDAVFVAALASEASGHSPEAGSSARDEDRLRVAAAARWAFARTESA